MFFSDILIPKESVGMKKFRSVLWGLCFLIVGFILILNALDLTKINIFFDGWWTLFIIVPCFVGLFTEDFFGNFLGFLIGLGLMGGCQGWISFGLIAKLIFPFTLVVIGLSILFHETFHNKVSQRIKKLNLVDGKSVVAIFSGNDVVVEEEYKGGDIEAIFGSVELDLRDAKLDAETPIKICSIFGGVTLIVPKNVNVDVKSIPIFGGVDCTVRKDNNAKKTIYIEAVAIFGGVDIK